MNYLIGQVGSRNGGLLLKPVYYAPVTKYVEVQFIPTGKTPVLEQTVEVEPEGGEGIRISSSDTGDNAILVCVRANVCVCVSRRKWNCINEVVWPEPMSLYSFLFNIDANPSNIGGESRPRLPVHNCLSISQLSELTAIDRH